MMKLIRYRLTPWPYINIFALTLVILLTGVSSFAQTIMCNQVHAPRFSLPVEFTAAKAGNPATVLIRDPINRALYAEGTVTQMRGRNFLQLTLITRSKEGGRSVLRGKESIHKIINEFESRGIRIDAFKAYWNDHLREFHAPSDNLVQFLKAYKDSLNQINGSLAVPDSIDNRWVPPEIEYPFLQAAAKAANATWSGRMMNELGFTHIEAIILDYDDHANSYFDHKEGYIDISVVWTKTPSEVPIKFYHHRQKYGSPDGSALPRLHEIIQSLP